MFLFFILLNMYKTIISFVACFLLNTLVLFAQSEPGTWSITPKAGANLATFVGHPAMEVTIVSIPEVEPNYETDFIYNPLDIEATGFHFVYNKIRFGYSVGVECAYQLSSHWALAAEVAYGLQGTAFDPINFPAVETEDRHSEAVSIDNARFSMHYVNVPLLARYYFLSGLSIEAGLQPSYCFSRKGYADVKFGVKDLKVDDEVNVLSRFDLSALIGVSYQFNQFVIGARYNVGLTNVYCRKWSEYDKKTDSARNSVFELTLGYRFDL